MDKHTTFFCKRPCGYMDRHGMCNYLLDTGHIRPCLAGADCTVRLPRHRTQEDGLAGCEMVLTPVKTPKPAKTPKAPKEPKPAEGARKVGGHRKPKWDVAEGRRLREKGLTFEQIAKKLRVHFSTVAQYGERHWADLPPLKRTIWDTDRGRELYEQGYTDMEIAEAVGAKFGTVKSYRSRNWGDPNPRRKS